MFLDHGTLLDLDIFATTAKGGLTLLALVDRTRSQAGRNHLRHRLLTPAETAEELHLLQDAHQCLATDLAAYRTLFDRADLEAVDRYVNTAWQIPGARRWLSRVVVSVWLGLRYSGYLREVARGQARVIATLRATADMHERLTASGSALLREHGEGLAELLETPECLALRRIGNRKGGAARLKFDQLARGAAKECLRKLIDRLGAIEAHWSISAATSEHGWNYPQVGGRLRITGLSHPFLGQEAVANDFDLDAVARVCFLTGPNMAGKSTFLKAVGIATLLAHVGSSVPAAAMEFVLVRSLFSSVQIVDNLRVGESFYLAEVRRIRGLANVLREHGSALAVLDEPFRGTNIHDASEATLALVSRLADHPRVVTLIASHLGEIGQHLASDPRIRLMHFAADVAVDPPRFDYLIREGVSQQRLGMVLLRQERVLELLEQAAGPISSETHETEPG